jgi:hypothetical protein
MSDRLNRGRSGNPLMKQQSPGHSINPGGRRKYTAGAKERMSEVAVEVVEFWITTMRDKSEDMSHRLRCSENLGWGYFGKPAQQVLAAHAHVNVEPPDDLKDADIGYVADVWAAMIGAREMPRPRLIESKPAPTTTSDVDDLDWSANDAIDDAPPAPTRISRRRKP